MNNNLPARTPSNYDRGIDLFKGIITISMVLSHVISVMGNSRPEPITAILNTALQLQSFSAFVFAFGFTTQLSYFTSEELNWRKVLLTIARIIGAFYIS